MSREDRVALSAMAWMALIGGLNQPYFPVLVGLVIFFAVVSALVLFVDDE